MKSKKNIIYHWEVKGGHGSEAVVSHIHLLSDNAFKNRAPNHLIKEHLTKITDEMELKNVTKDDIGNDFKKFMDRILLKFVYATVTRWQNYLFNFWPMTTMNIYPIAKSI